MFVGNFYRHEILFLSIKNTTFAVKRSVRMKFYLQRYKRNEDGVYVMDGVERSLEEDFGFVRYKSITGLNSRGKQKMVYTETYPESDSLRAFVSSSAKEESISSTLNVYVFGSSPEETSTLSVPEQIKAAEDSWHTLFDWLEGSLIVWRDDYRQRKALFMVSDACEPSTDNIKGIPYLQCAVKLVNVFGRTFAVSDTTIEGWLSRGGREEE